MWSKKKLKNKSRRQDRRHILDVKLRSSERRQTRSRRLALTLTLSFTVFTGLFLLWRGGEWLLRHFLFENAAFAVHQIDVQTDGVISPDQLRRWAGIKYDDNLLGLDLSRVKRDLELVPYVKSAMVERVLPHTLRIQVTEREPVAQFVYTQPKPNGQYEKGTLLLDGEGQIMWPLDPQQRSTPAQTNDHLPLFTGIQPGEVHTGRPIESPQVTAALQFLTALEKSPMAGVVEIKDVDLSVPNLLQVTTSQGAEVFIGFAEMPTQLRRWKAVQDHGVKIGKVVSWIDLSVANNVPARWLEAGLAPPPPIKTTKPSRNRKKNV
ncbi:MAG: ftsQ [Verrucomicrobiales bacterium]|jgi:cell division protein FtsQ|nr:ftsQ [Verrucomicrobiales bacterium]